MEVEWAAVCQTFSEDDDLGVTITGVGAMTSQPLPLPVLVEVPIAISLLGLNEAHVVENVYFAVTGPSGKISERGKFPFLVENTDIPPEMRNRKIVEVRCRFLAPVAGIYRLGFAAEGQKTPVVVDFYVDGSG
jgi:hypothetical protein